MDFFFLGRGRAGEEARTRWGLPLAEPADLAAAVPGGVACLLCRPPTLPLACYIAPIPRPPSRREGGDQGYFMQGASPLASPGLNPGGTGEGGEPRTRRGSLPLAEPVDLAAAVPGGWLAFFVACCPCLWLALLPPIPPTALAERSSPPGKGETKSLFRRGLPPPAPLH